MSAMKNLIQDVCDDMGWNVDGDGEDFESVETAETIADFDSSRAFAWSESGSRSEGEYGGFAGVMYTGVQIARGAQRVEFLVVDCGDKRLVFRAA